MILVDIYIPSLDHTYDFQVDENTPVENLIVEIVEMIGNQTRVSQKPLAESFLLFSMDREQILQRKASLKSHGVKNGSRLMLV